MPHPSARHAARHALHRRTRNKRNKIEGHTQAPPCAKQGSGPKTTAAGFDRPKSLAVTLGRVTSSRRLDPRRIPRADVTERDGRGGGRGSPRSATPQDPKREASSWLRADARDRRARCPRSGDRRMMVSDENREADRSGDRQCGVRQCVQHYGFLSLRTRCISAPSASSSSSVHASWRNSAVIIWPRDPPKKTWRYCLNAARRAAAWDVVAE